MFAWNVWLGKTRAGYRFQITPKEYEYLVQWQESYCQACGALATNVEHDRDYFGKECRRCGKLSVFPAYVLAAMGDILVSEEQVH